jgi:hypothetical protein
VVSLRVQVGRWHCRQPGCAVRFFTGALPGVAEAYGLPGVCVPHARHTQRFADIIYLVGYALGGRGGERLLERLGMAVSDDTLLRTLKRRAIPVTSGDVLRVVGIDDWAWRKGQHHFGTILVWSDGGSSTCCPRVPPTPWRRGSPHTQAS